MAFITNTSGYKLTLARKSQPEPQSELTMKQAQSDALRWTIEGGDRHPGDKATSSKHALKPTGYAKMTASGALQRFFTKELVGEIKNQGLHGGGGLYFGPMVASKDDIGFNLRPSRTRTHYKFGRKNKLVLAHPHGKAKVENIGKPKMLVRADKKSSHHVILP